MGISEIYHYVLFGRKLYLGIYVVCTMTGVGYAGTAG